MYHKRYIAHFLFLIVLSPHPMHVGESRLYSNLQGYQVHRRSLKYQNPWRLCGLRSEETGVGILKYLYSEEELDHNLGTE